MKNTVKILIISLSIIGLSAHINAKEPKTVDDIREIYNEMTRPQRDSIRATYEVIADVLKLDKGLKNFFESYYSNDETSSEDLDTDLFIILTSDEQIMLDFLNFGCGLDFGFRRCGYFFKPNLPELYQWYKNNFKYVTDEQLKKYCEIKSKIDLRDKKDNENFIGWHFVNYCLDKKYDFDIVDKFAEDEGIEKPYEYRYELQSLKDAFLVRQYNLEENKK